jgi:hypothetical protein
MSKPNANTKSKSPSQKPGALATLQKLQAKDPGLKRLLDKAYGYAVFPAVGKANLVVGGSLGRGEVFEKGKRIGFATITQLTIGVQVGGDTFDELVVFESREALERFKRGKTAFAANASAVLVKAGAATAKNFEKGAAVYVYPHGGMMLELGIGGQRFKFKPAEEQQDAGEGQGRQGSGKRQGQRKSGGAQGRGQEDEGEQDEQEQGESEGEEGEGEESGAFGGALQRVRSAAAKATDLVKRHPVVATVAGIGLATGLGLLIAHSMRAGEGDEGDEADEQNEDFGAEDEQQDEGEGAQDSAEDSGEESDEEEDEQDATGEQDEDSEQTEDRGILSRLMSRGKSRP